LRVVRRFSHDALRYRRVAGMARARGAGGRRNMSLLRWALILAVVSIVAAIFGFTDVSTAAADVAKFLFFVFVTLTVLVLAAAVFFYKRVT
jgi:uncharacterized membrane protein YtjA (UPF0391 family)